MTEATPLAPEQITRLREALKPFADLAEHDTSESDHDLDIWRPSGFTKCPNINVGHLRAAHAALSASPAPSGQGVSGKGNVWTPSESAPGEPIGALMICDQTGGRMWTCWPVPHMKRQHADSIYADTGGYRTVPLYAAPAPSCAPGEVERHLRDALNDSEELSDGTVNITAEHAAQLNADVDGWEARTLTIEQAWDELLNVDDRTSPEEYPDMCLIARDELADFMERAALSPQRLDAATVERDRIIAEARRNLRLTQGCLECNADDERRWMDTIAWLESLA